MAFLSFACPLFGALVAVVNQGFELPGTGKTEYWDVTGESLPTCAGWRAANVFSRPRSRSRSREQAELTAPVEVVCLLDIG
jgi:hypothetical protein